MSKKITVNSEFEVFNLIEDLNPEERELLNAAKKALEKAYAPYSRFYVGAAVLMEDGTIFTGNNQENAAYPSGLCAERVAIFHASSQYPDRKVKAIAVTAKTKDKLLNTPVSPCGACRQSMSEYEVKFKSPIRLIMQGEQGEIYISPSISNLLPLTFTSDSL